jgi:hypothetical protein
VRKHVVLLAPATATLSATAILSQLVGGRSLEQKRHFSQLTSNRPW